MHSVISSFYNVVCFVALASVLAACGQTNKELTIEDFNKLSKTTVTGDLNNQIRSAAILDKASSDDQSYYLGPGDLIEISVFRIEDLNTQVRVNGKGELFLPLLGVVKVSGLTVEEAELFIARKLEADFLQNPQVSIFVSEYRSQEITVMGAVTKPDIYSVTKSRSVVEMISLAGGVTEDAADSIRVSSSAINKESGELEKRNFVISINGLLTDRESLSQIRLKGGDAIFVPEAGVVYVEGAVEKPGAYKMAGDVTVLQALSLAGGAKWASNQSNVRVVRNLNGQPTSVEVNLNKVRDQDGQDVRLEDGDIVIVDYGTAKRLVSGFLNGVRSFVGFGYTLN